jgi:fatty-acyl-CoA synthase
MATMISPPPPLAGPTCTPFPEGTIQAALGGGAKRDEDLFCEFLQAGSHTTLRYGDIRRGAERYAGYLQRRGVRRGEVVMIVLRHSPDLFSSFLGALLIGAVPSFMPFPTSKQDPGLYWSSHQKLLDRMGAGTLLTYEENLAAVVAHTRHDGWRLVSASQVADAEARFVPTAACPDEIAFLQHSSGTTGLKKGVALTHRAVLRQVRSYAERLQLVPGDRVVSWLPLYHDMGLIACFLLPLITRTPAVMMDPFEWVVRPMGLFDAIRRFRGTLCWQPNFAFHHLCRTVRPSTDLDLSSMRAWINCSEPCRAETFDLFVRRFADVGVKSGQLQVCYAMAETVFAVTQTTPDLPAPRLTVDSELLRQGMAVSIDSSAAASTTVLATGRSISGLNVQIRDEQGKPVDSGRIGEVCISGDCLFGGYYLLPEETRRKLRNGWYHSGDLGFLHAGELYITGRKNDLIIVHGKNYYAHEIEYLVNEVAGVQPGRTVALGCFRPEVGSEEVIVIAEAAPGEASVRTDLAQRVKQTLLDQAGLLVLDVHVVEAGWLIKTTSGKISRIENLAKYEAERTAAAPV